LLRPLQVDDKATKAFERRMADHGPPWRFHAPELHCHPHPLAGLARSSFGLVAVVGHARP